MQLQHEFTVPVPVADAWLLLLDVQRLAPCLPGASLETCDGERFTGRVAVKLGAVQVRYQGTGEFVERDEAAHRMVLRANGSESRGSGTANATITAALHEEAGQTRVRVDIELSITGRAAQFGRGIITEVAEKIIAQFAGNLRESLNQTDRTGTPTDNKTQPEPLDAGAVALPAVIKRAALPAAAVASLIITAVSVRRRRAPRPARPSEATPLIYMIILRAP